MPAKPKKKAKRKARTQERDYSHRALLDKLGVKPGQRVAVLGIMEGDFLRELGGRISGFSREMSRGDADLIFYRAENPADLALVKALREAIRKDGAVWIVYPKGQKHIREADVMAAGKAAGFTDNKVARFSETHTALRFVIPISRR
jgi:Protein of unknown function (DUF3052)